jgi:hypothetical protein
MQGGWRRCDCEQLHVSYVYSPMRYACDRQSASKC